MDEGHCSLFWVSISSHVTSAVYWVKDLHLVVMLLSLQGPPLSLALQPPHKSIQLLVCPPKTICT